MSMIVRVLTVVLLLLLPVAPAAAAPEAPTATPHLGQITLGPGGAEKITLLWVRPEHLNPGFRHRMRLSLDTAAVARFADVDVTPVDVSIAIIAADYMQSAGPGPCRRSGTTLSCDWDTLLAPEESFQPVAVLNARPRAGATTGNEGEVRVTTRLGDGPARTATSVVRVGVGVDLAAGGPTEVEAAPGRTVAAAPRVRNAGATAVDGVVLVLDAPAPLLGRSSYRNCRYGAGMICTFDTALAAGRGYTLGTPIPLRPPADSIPGSAAVIRHQWVTATEWEEWLGNVPDPYLGTPGTGEPLTLEPVAAAQGEPQADVDPRNDSSSITLTVAGEGRPDLTAVGSRRTAAVGGEVVVTAGLINRGPGTLHPDLFGNNAVAATVRLPSNVTPAPDADGLCGGGDADYFCLIEQPLEPGQRVAFSFPVDVVDDCGEDGRVEVSDGLPGIASGRLGDSDNAASIRVSVPGATCGHLPITGPAALWTAVAGAVLVAFGLYTTTRTGLRACWRGNVAPGRRRKGIAR